MGNGDCFTLWGWGTSGPQNHLVWSCPGIRGELTKHLTTHRRLVFKWMIFYGPKWGYKYPKGPRERRGPQPLLHSHKSCYSDTVAWAMKLVNIVQLFLYIRTTCIHCLVRLNARDWVPHECLLGDLTLQKWGGRFGLHTPWFGLLVSLHHPHSLYCWPRKNIQTWTEFS